ncbi:MAG: glycosyltransferase family 39 protein [Chitinispirillaceae bacterium]|nr:glycosyltransferase family 39 protein [Chitinispirillaceae bacterium]
MENGPTPSTHSAALGKGILNSQIYLYCLLFAVALLVRLPGIEFHSLWFDETSTANVVVQPSYAELFSALYTFEGTPPLFYLVEKGFIDLLNVPANEYSLRLLPLLFSALSCTLIFVLFSLIGNRRIGLLSYILVTLSSFHIYLSLEARCYSFLGVMALATLLLIILWWQRATLLRSVLLCTAIIILVQIHYYAMLWVAAIVIAAFFTERKRPRFFTFLSLCVAAASVSFAFLMPLFLNQVSHEVGEIRDFLTAKWGLGTIYAPVKVMIGAYLFKINHLGEITARDLLGIVPVLSLFGIALFFLVGRIRDRDLSRTETMVIVAAACAYIFHVSLGWKIPSVHPRYMAHFLVLLFGLLLLAVRRDNRLVTVFFTVLLVLNGIGNYRFFDYSQSYIEPWRDIAAAVEKHIDTRDGRPAPVLTDMMISHSMAYYMKDASVPIINIPTVTDSIEYSRLDLFGHEFMSPLFHYTYFPVKGRVSLLDVMRREKQGIFIKKNLYGREKAGVLHTRFKGLVDFSLLRCFPTNQGDVCIFRWQYAGKS